MSHTDQQSRASYIADFFGDRDDIGRAIFSRLRYGEAGHGRIPSTLPLGEDDHGYHSVLIEAYEQIRTLPDAQSDGFFHALGIYLYSLTVHPHSSECFLSYIVHAE